MKVFIIILLLSSCFILPAQNRWQQELGESNVNNILMDKILIYDNGILLVTIGLEDQRFLVKTDKNGTELWRKTLQYTIPNLIPRTVYLYDDQILVGGNSSNGTALLSFNFCGQLNWCSTFESELYDANVIHDITNFQGKIIALTYLQPVDQSNRTDRIYLLCYDLDGNFLWKKVYAGRDNYPEMDFPFSNYIENFNDHLLISGYCFYPFPQNPGVMGLRPLFIKIDSLFNEEWVLPYGIDDDLLGWAGGSIKNNLGNGFISAGGYNGPLSVNEVTNIMYFDESGEESGFDIIQNEQIGNDIEENWSYDIKRTNGGKFLLNSNFGTESYENPYGELLVDSNIVISSLSHPNSIGNVTRSIITNDSTYLFGINFFENPPSNLNRDILLYELNSDLTQAEIDTSYTEYDYLCDDLPILSDTVFIDGCSIVTSIDDAPDLEEYLASRKKIKVNISPNPGSDIIQVSINNPDNNAIIFECYDISGGLVFTDITDSDTFDINISGYHNGIYFINVSDDNGRKGSGKFIKK